MNKLTKNSQRGVILIIVLWFVAIVIIIVATLANEVRLSAKTVLYNKMGLQTWSDSFQALRAAEMELLINRMPDPPGTKKDIPLSERKNKRYRFDGRILELAYEIPDTVNIRIYDHAGKINIQRLTKQRLRKLLEKRIGNDIEKLDALIDAWEDWKDSDDLKRINGVEDDYYEKLSPPYRPRNSRLETVEEILLIKGFAEVFKGVEMDTAFTVYGTTSGVNPNLATREALMLLPGISGEAANTILTKRREKEFKSYKDFNEFIEIEQLAKLRSWINFSTSNFYTIAIQAKKIEEIAKLRKDDEDSESVEEADKQSNKPISSPAQAEEERAYTVIVQPRGFNRLPRILMINPYGVLPNTSHELIPLDGEDDKSTKKFI